MCIASLSLNSVIYMWISQISYLFGMFFLIHDFLLISGLKMGIGRGAELKAWIVYDLMLLFPA